MNLVFILWLFICQSSKVTSSFLKGSEDLIIFEKSEHILAINEIYNKNLSLENFEEYPYDTSLLWNLKPKTVTFAAKNEVFIFSTESNNENASKNSGNVCQNSDVDCNSSPTSVLGIDEAIVSETTFITTEWIKNIMIPTFLAGEMLPMHQIKTIIKEATYYFKNDKTIHDIKVNPSLQVIIVGDIHGQFESTLTIFEDFGFPSNKNIYLFNGDIVDRGDKSVECLLMVYAFKVALGNTKSFFMGRGNHESRTVSKGTFYNECLTKLKEYPEAFNDFHLSFEALPYGFVVRDKIFVTHGGLCPGMRLKSLKYLCRDTFNFKNVREFYAMLWNDPCDDSMATDECGMANNPRGKHCRFFNQDVTISFLHKHHMKLLVRSHELVPEGFRHSHANFCLTIFSAPNYQGRRNAGAILIITNDTILIGHMRR